MRPPELAPAAHFVGSVEVVAAGVAVKASTGDTAGKGVAAGAEGLRIFLKKLNMSGLWSQGIL